MGVQGEMEGLKFTYATSYIPSRAFFTAKPVPNGRSKACVTHLPITSTRPLSRKRDDPGSSVLVGLLPVLGNMDIVLLRYTNLTALLTSSSSNL